jgi:hypothetical protein
LSTYSSSGLTGQCIRKVENERRERFSHPFHKKTGENIDSRLFLFDSRRDRRAKFQDEKNSDLAQRTAISFGK